MKVREEVKKELDSIIEEHLRDGELEEDIVEEIQHYLEKHYQYKE